MSNNFKIFNSDPFKKLQKVAENKAVKLAEEILAAESSLPEVSVDLGKFELVNNGSAYLDLTHPALEHMASLGKVAVAEYTAATNKEEFLKEVFIDSVASQDLQNKFSIVLVGTFKEPILKKADLPEQPKEMCECVDFNCPAHRRGICQKPATQHLQAPGEGLSLAYCDECAKDIAESGVMPPEEELDMEPLTDVDAKMADSYRQTQERDAQALAAQKEKITLRAGNHYIKHLQSLGYEGIKITATDDSAVLIQEGREVEGTLKFQTLLGTKAGQKLTTLTVKIAGDEIIMPSEGEIEETLEDTESLDALLFQNLQQGVVAKQAAIDAEEAWKAKEIEAILKTAADENATQYVGPTTVMHLNKNLLGLPEDTKVGTVVFADGAHWKLVDKDKSKLSKGENDGSIWTFERVPAGDKKPEHTLPI